MARVPPACFGSCCLPISAARATTAVAAPAQIKLVANSWLIVQEDRWVVRACRYPHLCDSQAVACLPRVPGGPDGSLIVTGAADGSIKWMRNLTELAVGPRTAEAHIHCLPIHSHVCSCLLRSCSFVWSGGAVLQGLKAPCLPFCLSPSLRGLQRPKVIWKKRLLVCPSATDIGIWCAVEAAETNPPLDRIYVYRA